MVKSHSFPFHILDICPTLGFHLDLGYEVQETKRVNGDTKYEERRLQTKLIRERRVGE